MFNRLRCDCVDLTTVISTLVTWAPLVIIAILTLVLYMERRFSAFEMRLDGFRRRLDEHSRRLNTLIDFNEIIPLI